MFLPPTDPTVDASRGGADEVEFLSFSFMYVCPYVYIYVHTYMYATRKKVSCNIIASLKLKVFFLSR